MLVLLLVNKPACEVSNESLLTIVQSQDGPRGPMGRFYMHSVGRSWLMIGPYRVRISIVIFGITSQTIDSYSMSWSYILKTRTVYARLKARPSPMAYLCDFFYLQSDLLS